MAQGEWEATREFIEAGLTILEQENPMTVRQLFYRLVSAGLIPNSHREYCRVSRLMTKARRDERCPFEWLVDRSRPTYEPNVFENPQDYAEVIKRSYRRDYWGMQPNYVEIWCEKDAVIGSIENLTGELGVTLRVSRGFMSATRVNDIARHLNSVKKPKTVFYLGDHDPSGRGIQDSAYEKVQHRAYELCPLVGDAFEGVPFFELERVAIHEGDIAEFNLPPLRMKTDEAGEFTDSRAKRFLAEFNGDCIELDALPPTELRRRIREAIESKLDRTAWKRAIEIEGVELRSIVETVSAWRPTA
jgi:hypothetical protein